MKMNSLSNLLAHELVDLYSAEEQILEALPRMIEKAQNQELKKSLSQHLKVTEQHKKRLEKAHKLMQQEDGSSEEQLGDTECLGMKGLIEEGEKAMGEEMEPDVMDAAIIASAQKIEHYEISGYGTACAFARELGLTDIEKLLNQTLEEEYQADDQMTDLAVGQVNDEAEGEGAISVRRLPASRGSNARKATTQRSSSRSSTSRAASNGSSRSAAGTGKRSNGSRSTRTKKSATSARSKSTTSRSKSTSGGSRSKSKTRGR